MTEVRVGLCPHIGPPTPVPEARVSVDPSGPSRPMSAPGPPPRVPEARVAVDPSSLAEVLVGLLAYLLIDLVI